MHEIESEGDPRYHLPPGEPIITPQRAAKGDVFTGPQCKECGGSGKVKPPIGTAPATCGACRGRGWVGSINAATMDNADIRHAQVREVNLLNSLWNSQQITDQQHHDGQTFQIWRDMHRVQMGLARPVSSGGDEALGVRLRAYGFILLIRRLNRLDYAAIETSLIPMMMPWAEWLARNRLEKYITALERLSRLLPPIKDQIAYLEGLPEPEREELSISNINKLLADIKNP